MLGRRCQCAHYRQRGNTVRVALYVPEDIASPGVFAATAPNIVAAMSSNGDASSVAPLVAALRRVSEQKIGQTQLGRFPGATCKFLVQHRVHTNSSMDCEPEQGEAAPPQHAS